MRPIALLVASLLAFGAFAGCIGGSSEKGEPLDDTSLPDGTTAPGGTVTAPQVKVLAPLVTSLTLDAPDWIVSGTEVPVKVTAPANAKGAVTYAFATGALPGTVKVDPIVLDTGSKGSDYIAPGASKSLTFATAGVYMMHCHPHPFMLQNITVVDGYAGPKTVEVLIVDGAQTNEYRFVPENIVIGAGTKVTYKNVGAQPHTATGMGTQSPPLTLASAASDKAEATVKVNGTGWQRVLAIVTDSEGRVGLAEKNIYATETLPVFDSQTLPFDFTYGAAPLAGTPAEASAKSAPVTLEQPGKVTITFAFTDAASAAENLAQVEIHLTKDGETQDTLTGGPAADGVLEGKAIAGAYTLTVVPMQGIEISGTVVIDVVYDLIPPAPAMQEEDAGHGGHGGHAH